MLLRGSLCPDPKMTGEQVPSERKKRERERERERESNKSYTFCNNLCTEESADSAGLLTLSTTFTHDRQEIKSLTLRGA